MFTDYSSAFNTVITNKAHKQAPQCSYSLQLRPGIFLQANPGQADWGT